MGLETLTTAQLTTLIRNGKRRFLEFANTPESEWYKFTGKKCSLAAMNTIGVFILESLEAEVWRRGMDPRHPVFGIDLLGMH